MSMSLYVGCKATVSVLCTTYRNGISGKSGVIKHVWSSRRPDGIAGADQEVWPENYDIYGISIYGMRNALRTDGCFIVSGKDLIPCDNDYEETDMWTKANPNLGMIAQYCKNDIAAVQDFFIQMAGSINPEKIIFNGPKTIVLWADGSKTIVSCKAEEQFDPYAGFCAALANKSYQEDS